VSVLDDKTNTVTTTIPAGKSVAGIAVNSSTGIAYVSNYKEKTISVIYMVQKWTIEPPTILDHYTFSFITTRYEHKVFRSAGRNIS